REGCYTLTKDEEAADVDVHLYRSMISSLMYLAAYSDSDYARVNLDRKSTIGEAEYVAAANCYGQVL
ncbi:hypothetical protein Tco_0351020, partial [Tanacetum coccineum]